MKKKTSIAKFVFMALIVFEPPDETTLYWEKEENFEVGGIIFLWNFIFPV